jgi:hypothetical protein
MFGYLPNRIEASCGISRRLFNSVVAQFKTCDPEDESEFDPIPSSTCNFVLG